MSAAKDKVVERFIEEISSPADWVAFILGGGLGFCASVLVAGADAGQFAVGGGFVAMAIRKATARLLRRTLLRRRGRVFLRLLDLGSAPLGHNSIAKVWRPGNFFLTEQGRKSIADTGMRTRFSSDLELFECGLVNEDWFESALLGYVEEFRTTISADQPQQEPAKESPELSNSVRGGFNTSVPAVPLPDLDEEQRNQEKLNQ